MKTQQTNDKILLARILLASTSFIAKAKNASNWIIDSGATAHITSNEANLCDMRAPSSHEITVGDNGRVKVKCAGDVRMKISANGKSNKEQVTVKHVLCVPNIFRKFNVGKPNGKTWENDCVRQTLLPYFRRKF